MALIAQIDPKEEMFTSGAQPSIDVQRRAMSNNL